MKNVQMILATAHREGWWEGLLHCLAWRRAAGADPYEPSKEERRALALLVPTVVSPEDSDRSDEPHGVIDEGLMLKQLERRRRAISREIGYDGLPRTIAYLERAGATLGLEKARAKLARLRAEHDGVEASIRTLKGRPVVKFKPVSVDNAESTAALAGPRGPLN